MSTAHQFEPLPGISIDDVKRDIDVLLWSMKLCWIRRYFHQRFWESESTEAEYAARIEPMPRLETVAEHSWHVADSVMLIGGHFPKLNVDRCVKLAILHDKMEISIGDANPVGRSGTGATTHAFNTGKRLEKESAEAVAIKKYLNRLRESLRDSQASMLFELLEGRTAESRFVKAVDKLQALAFVLAKKKGVVHDKHLRFTLKYSEKVIAYYTGLHLHYADLSQLFLVQVARRRDITAKELEEVIHSRQLPLMLIPSHEEP